MREVAVDEVRRLVGQVGQVGIGARHLRREAHRQQRKGEGAGHGRDQYGASAGARPPGAHAHRQQRPQHRQSRHQREAQQRTDLPAAADRGANLVAGIREQVGPERDAGNPVVLQQSGMHHQQHAPQHAQRQRAPAQRGNQGQRQGAGDEHEARAQQRQQVIAQARAEQGRLRHAGAAGVDGFGNAQAQPGQHQRRQRIDREGEGARQPGKRGARALRRGAAAYHRRYSPTETPRSRASWPSREKLALALVPQLSDQ
ncbi:hypothetical protein G4G28_18295 [Massilia sp. Dwa41.01b]|uniref:hypothetical protein n=1 Tax=Massilia sp. Dwa41.01b TaxID=2709302 RepID=UPI00160449E1|nr:hypothetical protein [Massilia sp. Dwa41.01b]QNA89962.1 hypothetical protein G4G28_18295 [Massilia sp. Dwa41.01b]